MIRTLLVALALGLVTGGTCATCGAANLLLNGNLDAHHPIEFDPLRYPDTFNEYPEHWEMTSDFNYPSPFLDGFSSEAWAGGSPSPDTGPDDRGVFFKSFYGGAPFPGDLNPTITTHMSQSLPSVPGATYVFKGWAAAESNYSGLIAAGGQTFFALDFLSSGGNVIQSVALDLEANGLAVDPRDGAVEGPWNFKEYTVIGLAPPGAANVRARVSMIEGFYTIDPGQALIVDDFTLEAVPEPGSGVLAGVFLSSAALWRRRCRRAA